MNIDVKECDFIRNITTYNNYTTNHLENVKVNMWVGTVLSTPLLFFTAYCLYVAYRYHWKKTFFPVFFTLTTLGLSSSVAYLIWLHRQFEAISEIRCNGCDNFFTKHCLNKAQPLLL